MPESKEKPPNPRITGKALSEKDFAEIAVIEDDIVKEAANQAVPAIKSYLRAEPTIDGS